MAKNAISDGWFNKRQGRDFPGGRHFLKHIRSKPCRVGFTESSEVFKCHVSFEPDSQSPRIVLTVGKASGEANPATEVPRASLVFRLQDNSFEFGIEEQGHSSHEKIKQMRLLYPDWFKDLDQVSCIQITPRNGPITVGQPWLLKEDNLKKRKLLCDNVSTTGQIFVLEPWKPSWTVVKDIHEWFLLLQNKIHANQQSTDLLHPNNKGLAAFWFHYANLPKEDEGEVRNPWEPNPQCPWLLSEDRTKYATLSLIGPHFLDDHERRMRLINSMKVERQEQKLMITRVFNANLVHAAIIKEAERGLCHLHVQVCFPKDVSFPVPELTEGTEVTFSVDGMCASKKGKVVDVPTDAKFVILVKGSHLGSYVPNQACNVKIEIKPNLEPVEDQIDALAAASSPEKVFGDKPDNHGKGFSLRRTILAHGRELDQSNSEEYFVLNIENMSPLPREIIQDRLRHIKKVCVFNEAQRSAYDRSLTNMTCGISLIQGPPGTGEASQEFKKEKEYTWSKPKRLVLAAVGLDASIYPGIESINRQDAKEIQQILRDLLDLQDLQGGVGIRHASSYLKNMAVGSAEG